MKLVLLIFSIILSSNLLFGQVEISHVGYLKEKEILKNLKKDILVYGKKSTKGTYTLTETHHGDTLIITYNCVNPFIRKFTFNGELNNCDFEQLLLSDCDSCSIWLVQDLLADKSMKWKEIEKNKYLSSYFWQTELTLDYSGHSYCTAITFRTSKLNEKDYKKLRGDN